MDVENGEDDIKIKKCRKFHAKEFRENLKSNNALAAVKEFVLLCTEEKATQDYALEFIENGGTLSELLCCLDSFDKKNAKDAVSIFEAFNIILLKLLSKRADKLSMCEQTCREFLVKYYPFIKSMLSLSSSSKQRRVALKLLSSVSAMSVRLAKEVLAYAVFDQAVLDVLIGATGTAGVDTSVRTAFIHFLLSFLVQGNTQLTTQLLDKRGLITSIFLGLVHDAPPTVELVLATLKERVLEDKRLSKTTKMTTFNTQSIKQLFDLYDWRGPQSRKSGNMRKRAASSAADRPDNADKERVAVCAHEFLLTLLTTKWGVIFRGANPLVGSVLGLVKGDTWLERLPGELLVRVCGACPDLLPGAVAALRAALLPARPGQKWLKAARLVAEAITAARGGSIDAARSKTIDTAQDGKIETIRGEFIETTRGGNIETTRGGILETAQGGTINATSDGTIDVTRGGTIKATQGGKLQTALGGKIDTARGGAPDAVLEAALGASRHENEEVREAGAQLLVAALGGSSPPPLHRLPQPQCLLVPAPSRPKHMLAALHALRLYRRLYPTTLHDLAQQVNPLEHMRHIANISPKDDAQIAQQLFTHSLHLFLYCDFAAFLPTTQLFEFCMPHLLNIYVANKNTQNDIEKAIFELIKNTGIFDGCLYEINVWLHALLECNYNEDIGRFLMSSLKLTYTNYMEYCKEISAAQENLPQECVFNYKHVIESLALDVQDNKCADVGNWQRALGPLALGAQHTLGDNASAPITQYVKIALVHLLHAQTTPQIITTIVSKHSSNLDKNLIKYFHKWNDCQTLISLKKIYENKNTLTKLSKFLIENDTDVSNFEEYDSHQIILSAKMVVFYLTQLARTRYLTQEIHAKCLNAIEILLTKSVNNDILDVILKHPLLIQIFSPINKGDPIHELCTNFILKVIDNLVKIKSKIDLESYMYPYRTILIRQIYLLLEKCKKHKKAPKNSNVMQIVEVIELTGEQCHEVLQLCGSVPSECLITPENTLSTVSHLLSYTLQRSLQLSCQQNAHVISVETMTLVTQHLLYLNKYQVEINIEDIEVNLYNYIEQYPHTIAAFDQHVFKTILLKQTINRNTCRLARILLSSNYKFFEVILQVIDEIVEKRELIFSLLFALLDHQTNEVQQFFKDMYLKHDSIIMKVINKPQKAAQYFVEYYRVIIKIVETVMTKEICEEFCSKIHKFDSSEIYHYEILISLFDRCIKGNESENKYIYNLIMITMNYILNILKRPERSDLDNKKMENIVESFVNYLKKLKVEYKREYIDESLIKNATFESFSKMCLKYGLNGCICLLRALRTVCDLGGVDGSADWRQELRLLAVSHSAAMDVLLGPSGDPKLEFVRLLAALGGGKAEERDMWLRAYGASTSETDRCLLRLIAGAGDCDGGVMLWGEGAGATAQGGALWKRPTPGAALDLLDPERVRDTITRFPVWRSLDVNEPPGADDDSCDVEGRIYDPAWYVPLAAAALASGGEPVAWYRCKQALLPLCVVALGSERACTRRGALLALARLHALATARGARGKDRLLYAHLVEAVCRNERLLPLAAVFVARASLVLARPDHALYPAVSAWLVARQRPDVGRVPELLELLHSSHVQHSQHRQFVLEAIRDGLKTKLDLAVAERSAAWKLLMGGGAPGGEVLQVLGAAALLPTGARSLCADHGLLTWILGAAPRLPPQPLIRLLHDIYHALEPEHKRHVHFNMLLCLIAVLPYLQALDVKHLVLYLRTLQAAYMARPALLNREHLMQLVQASAPHIDTHICTYYLKYGTDFVQKPTLSTDTLQDKGLYYLKLLTLHWIQINKDIIL